MPISSTSPRSVARLPGRPGAAGPRRSGERPSRPPPDSIERVARELGVRQADAADEEVIDLQVGRRPEAGDGPLGDEVVLIDAVAADAQAADEHAVDVHPRA